MQFGVAGEGGGEGEWVHVGSFAPNSHASAPSRLLCLHKPITTACTFTIVTATAGNYIIL